MNLLTELQARFHAALVPLVEDPAEFTALVRPSQDPKFGDYQANFAMPLGKRLNRPPREIAQQAINNLQVADLCDPPELAGPGFINLRLRDDWISQQLQSLLQDDRLGVAATPKPRTIVIDYSAPNVAKPMHVGHIRSTVIGAALEHVLRFLGHRVITDNHIGDWGTQFGMIIYGYKHFRDLAAYQKEPVKELSRLYRLVSQIIKFHEDRAALPELRNQLGRQEKTVTDLVAKPIPADKNAAKQAEKTLKKAEDHLDAARQALSEAHERIARVESDPQLEQLANAHPQIAEAVHTETAKLHAGDAQNLALWNEVLPACRHEIDRIYRRLNVSFDHTLGESFYHDRLAAVVDDLSAKQIAKESNGAICVFLEGHETPFLIRKHDGAFLYATTDLATIQYRLETWQPDAILYVVDHRQSLHFEQLFATAKKWGFANTELEHISFGTVLGDDGKPFKTRSGDTVGLESLLDEAVSRALAIVSANDDTKPGGAVLNENLRQQVAERVGIGALKYADLSQNRTSDYVFSYDKMLAMNGNTATYMQYAYARVLSIFAKGEIDVATLRKNASPIRCEQPAERALAMAILQLPEALDVVVADYRPNHLTSYLFELANRYSTFFEQCPVLKADSEATRTSRLKLCDLTARTIKLGLSLLGIEVVEKM